MINKLRLIKLTQELIRIDSQNPPGDESKIANFVKRYLRAAGIESKMYEFKHHRTNIIAVLKGRTRKKSLLITPHLDTVPAGKNWRFPPFSGTISQGRIYGLGATDCKCNLSCSMEVLRSLVEDRVELDYSVVFAATADEESGSYLGLIPLLDKGILRPDAAVVLDSDDFGITTTQKGLIHMKIKIQGKRAHGAYPWKGVNAIEQAAKIIRALKSHGFAGKKNKLLRAPTLNIGTIKGGDKVNVVADWCEFEVDVRFLPGMSARSILQDMRAIVKKYTRKFSFEIEGIQEPYEIDENHCLVTSLAAAMRKCRITPKIVGSEGATTITFFQNHHIPAVATGCGAGDCAHTVNEFVVVDNLYKGARVLEEFLKKFAFED